MTRRVKAADIPDETLLRVVDHIQREAGMWALVFDIHAVIEDCGIPWKVVNAKLAKLVKRGLLDGCTCGCRGDFELTDKGRELIGADPQPEPEPLPVTTRIEDGFAIHTVPSLVQLPWMGDEDEVPVLLESGYIIATPEQAEAAGLTADARRMRRERGESEK